MASTAKIQDMPPPGGYSAIPYQRVLGKKVFPNAFSLVGTLAVVTTIGGVGYFYAKKKWHMEEVEMRSSRFALLPMMLAERDRAFLKQMRKNRDEEAELMKNVEGWEVGTLFGKPIFNTVPKDTFIEPTLTEYYAHTDYKYFARRDNVRFYN